MFRKYLKEKVKLFLRLSRLCYSNYDAVLVNHSSNWDYEVYVFIPSILSVYNILMVEICRENFRQLDTYTQSIFRVNV